MADVEGQVSDDGQVDAEREARRRLALAQIRQYPDAALRLPARPVEVFDEDLRRLVERMKRLMEEARGIGLAGPQVGVLQRVFVFQPNAEDVVAVVNPEVVERSEETEIADEGCLSIQGVLVPVERDLAGVEAETVVVCAYGRLIPEAALERALWLNVHPSLLPRWRGAAPVERALIAGDTRTGVTIHRTTAELDAGPIAAREAF